MKNTKSIAQSRKDFRNLEQTLQEANKLPPAKPKPFDYEKMLLEENGQNPYQMALFYMQRSLAKSNIVEQKSLLLESF